MLVKAHTVLIFQLIDLISYVYQFSTTKKTISTFLPDLGNYKKNIFLAKKKHVCVGVDFWPEI